MTLNRSFFPWYAIVQTGFASDMVDGIDGDWCGVVAARLRCIYALLRSFNVPNEKSTARYEPIGCVEY